MSKLNPNELDAQAFLFIGPPQTIGNLNPTNTGTIKHLRSRRATVKAARHELPTPLIGFSWRARIDRSAQRLRLLNAKPGIATRPPVALMATLSAPARTRDCGSRCRNHDACHRGATFIPHPCQSTLVFVDSRSGFPRVACWRRAGLWTTPWPVQSTHCKRARCRGGPSVSGLCRGEHPAVADRVMTWADAHWHSFGMLLAVRQHSLSVGSD